MSESKLFSDLEKFREDFSIKLQTIRDKYQMEEMDLFIIGKKGLNEFGFAINYDKIREANYDNTPHSN